MVMPLAGERRGIPLRAVVPNAVTALALCSGLTGVRFAIAAQWENADLLHHRGGVLDGLDGRIARALRGQTRFGAELDSLSDVIAFGVSPAIILHLWALQELAAVRLDLRACLRRLHGAAPRPLQRADRRRGPAAQIGRLPDRRAGAGRRRAAAAADLSVAGQRPAMGTGCSDYRLVAPWAAFVAFLVISSVATFSLGLAAAAAQRPARGDRA